MPSPWPESPPTPTHRAAYADATPRSFWLDTLPPRADHPPLGEVLEADLCIIGGGYTGLWAALYARELEPTREVVLLEATRCGDGASRRNGGFLQSSLTHGTRNGLARFPDELERLERLGFENFECLIQTCAPSTSTPSSSKTGTWWWRSSRASWPIWTTRPSCSPATAIRSSGSMASTSAPRSPRKNS